MAERNREYYKAVIAYDGTQYKGWQSQKEGQGIVDCIIKQIKKTFDYECDMIGASRTDAGVHAYGQTVRFCLPQLSYEPSYIMKIINDHLPTDIHFRKIEKTDLTFNPRMHALSKTYHYYISFKRPLPYHARYVTYYPYHFNFNLFQQALDCFIGEHDFALFSKNSENKKTIKTVDICQATWCNKQQDILRIKIVGKSFLHNMIRRMIGGALTISRRNLDPEIIKLQLKGKMSQIPLFNAPANGLSLMSILYKNEENNDNYCYF